MTLFIALTIFFSFYITRYCLYTVAQKTVQMFACFGEIALLQNADIIQGSEFFITRNTAYYLSKTF